MRSCFRSLLVCTSTAAMSPPAGLEPIFLSQLGMFFLAPEEAMRSSGKTLDWGYLDGCRALEDIQSTLAVRITSRGYGPSKVAVSIGPTRSCIDLAHISAARSPAPGIERPCR